MGSGEREKAAEATLLLTPFLGAADRGGCFEEVATEPPADTDCLVVSYRRSPDEVLESWRTAVGDRPANFGIIAVGAGTRSARAAGAEADAPRSPGGRLVTTVADPRDMTELDVAVSLYLDEWVETGRATHVCVESVDALLAEFPVETVFRLLHVLVARLRQSGASAHFHLAPTCDEETVDTLRPLFDAVYDPREPTRDGGRAVTRVDDGPAAAADAPALPEATVEALLRSSRRRTLVGHLLATDPPVSVRRLAERVARSEAADEGAPPDQVSEETVESVHITLHHVHLPKLVDADVVALSEDLYRVETVRHLAAFADEVDPVPEDAVSPRENE